LYAKAPAKQAAPEEKEGPAMLSVEEDSPMEEEGLTTSTSGIDRLWSSADGGGDSPSSSQEEVRYWQSERTVRSGFGFSRVCTSQGDEGSSATNGRFHLADIFRIADQQRWVAAWCRGGELLLGRDGDPLSSDSLAGFPAKLVIVVAHLPGQDVVLERLIKKVREIGGPEYSIYLLQLRSEAASQTLRLQSLAIAAGADDMMLGIRCEDDLELAVAMCSKRRQARVEELEQQRAAITAGFEEQLNEGIRSAQEAERANAIVWQMADSICPGFPCPDLSLEADPCVGAKVGPCRLTAELGKGAFGRVYRCVNDSSGVVEAVKVLSKRRFADRSQISALWKEVSLHQRLRHENVVSFLGVMHGPRHIFLRLEVAGSVNLFQYLKSANDQRLSLEKTRNFSGQLMAAIAYCHTQGVAHRDLKPENIAVGGIDNNPNIKVLDFGHSTNAKKPRTDIAGTFPFMAPEVIVAGLGMPYSPMTADIWASGVVMLEMACGLRQMDRMLGWERSTPLEPRRRDELERFFTGSAALERAVRERAPGAPVGFLDALQGALCVSTEARWDAPRLRRCVWLRSGSRSSRES